MWLSPDYVSPMRFLVIQHLNIEPPALIGSVLEEAGHELIYTHVNQGEALPENTAGFSGAIIMGGPQSADNAHLDYIRAELDWLKTNLDAGLPMLGICLGSQLMAKAAGGNISASPLRELGWYPVFPTAQSPDDPLFSPLPDQGLTVFQWHGETFSLPDTATTVASHPDVAQQAFRLGLAQYGLQFHIEVDQTLIELWIRAGDSERAHLGEEGLTLLRGQTPLYLSTMRAYCHQMLGNWLALLR
ncbi:MAG: type 1 glutamine amidotransferase [Mariprofundaceae bacterium]|nr:type 1 glutamine amidotransferase [Mariprofundaceae bacterium]